MLKAEVKEEDPDGHVLNSTAVNIKEEPPHNVDDAVNDNECRNTPTEPSLPSR